MDLSQKKVLIVEDDAFLRKILVDQLSLRYLVLQAKDGLDALEQIKSKHPDIVLLDLLLPKMDGIAVLEHMRAAPGSPMAKIPVLVVSNLTDTDTLNKTKKLGVVDYLVKANIDFISLVSRINRVLGTGT